MLPRTFSFVHEAFSGKQPSASDARSRHQVVKAMAYLLARQDSTKGVLR